MNTRRPDAKRRGLALYGAAQLLALLALLLGSVSYVGAANEPILISIGAQLTTPVYGTAGTATFSVDLTTTAGNGTFSIEVTGLPAGATAAPTSMAHCKNGCTFTLTISTLATTPAVDNLPFTVTAGGSTGASTTGYLTITGRALTVTAVSDTKTYDGTTTSTRTPTMTGSLYPGDAVTLSQAFNSRNAGPRTLVPTVTFTSGSASNYAITYANAAGTINQRAITVTAAAASKSYDGTTASTATPTVTSGSLVTGDISSFSETYSSRNVGSGLTLTPSGSVSDGNSGLNYLVTFVNATGSITARPITVTAATNTKGYDGTTSAAAVPQITSGSLADGDSVTWTEAYTSAGVGTNKTLVPAGTVNDGNGGHNYAVTFVNVTTGVITAYTVTITPDAGQTKVYGTSDPTLTYTYSGLQPGDTAAVFSGSLSRVAGENAGTYAFTLGTLSAGPNYTVQLAAAPATFEITKAASVVTVHCPTTAAYTSLPVEPCTAEATGVGITTPIDVSASLTYTNNVNLGTATANASWAGDTNHTGNTGSATFLVVPNALHHIVLSPSSSTITAGGSQAYTVEGFDRFGNSLGDVTADTTFAIDTTPCDGATCSPTATGTHTVTATDGTITGTATLTVTGAALDHMLLSPADAGIRAGESQAYTAAGFDRYGNSLGDVTGSTTFTVDGASCPAATCAPTAAGVHTVTGTNGSVTAAATLRVSPSDLARIVVSPGSGTATAGDHVTYTAEGFDASDNSIGDVTAASVFMINGTPCVANVCTATTVGHATVTATDGSVTGTASLDIVAAAAVSIVLTSGITTENYTWRAGENHSLYVRAFDAYGNLAAGYAGTVHFTSSDPAAVLPPDYTFTAADAGFHAWPLIAVLKTAGSQSITVEDDAALTRTMHAIAVLPAGSSTLAVTDLSGLTAGVGGSFTVTLRDKYGNVATNYRGTVHMSSSDTRAVLPADYTFTAVDGGVHSFPVTFKTSGHQSVLVADTSVSWLKGGQWTDIHAGDAVSLLVKSGAYDWMAGDAHSLSVAALDEFGNVATGYAGTVRFATSDPLGTVPADYTFTAADAGAHMFMFLSVLKTAGAQTISATDTATPSITGTVGGIVVQPNGANSMQLSALPNPFVVGTTQSLTVTLRDKYGNVASRYIGTIHFTSSDSLAGLPADYTFTAADRGVHTFTVNLNTKGLQWVMAADVTTVTWVKAKVSTNVQ